MLKTINGWVRIRDNFVKKLDKNLYDVIRLVDHEDFVYYETYYKVTLKDITKESFSRYGSYDEYIKEETDEEKAVYFATFGSFYDETYTCYNESEIQEILIEDGVVSSDSIFEFIL